MDGSITWTAWHWLTLGFGLLIAEILIPGVFLLWWGLSAIIIAAMALFIGLPLATLIVTYAILALILSFVWWKYQHKKDLKDQIHTSLNQRNNSMIGSIGIVREINLNGIGRGHFGDTTWRIQGKNLHIEDQIEVYKVEGITLFVRKVE